MDIKSCGVCCAGFSVFAFFFLIIVGSILNNANETVIPIASTSQSAAASACFAGAGLYAGCVGISAICYVWPRIKLMIKGGSDLQSLIDQQSKTDSELYTEELV